MTVLRRACSGIQPSAVGDNLIRHGSHIWPPYLPAERLFDLDVALLTAYPVLAVAFLAARLLPDEFQDLTPAERYVPVSAWWAERGWRRWILRRFTKLIEEDINASGDSVKV